MTELLVVIAIVGVLTAALVPTLISARRRAQQVACAGNLSQMSAAHGMYEIDFQEGPYCLTLSEAGESNTLGKLYETRSDWVLEDWSALWMGQLEPYLKSFELYECPSSDMRTVNTFDAPQLVRPILLGYGWNQVHDTHRGERRVQDMKNRRKLIRGRESDHLLFVDLPFYKFFYMRKYLLLAGFANASRAAVCHQLYCPDDGDKRHPSGSNVLFFDGHIEAMDFPAIWKWLNYEGAEKPPNGYVIR